MIDWTRVTELHREVGAEDFEEVVTLFVEEVEAALDALDHDDPSPEHLHFLKGSALNLGFTALAQQCAPPGNTAALRACFAESKASFLSQLQQRLAA
ncbi:MAG: histidine kinase [Rhodosalinus sp.]|uniref:histidine kinase n=1 Tax=Rhodosalinus sp. TaxID=2047741 RepID=UPI00397AA21B